MQNSTFDYDANDRLTDLVHYRQSGFDMSPMMARGYGYDAEGNRRYTENFTMHERGERYGHDNRNRLTVMDRGLLSFDAGGAVTVEAGDYLEHPKLAAVQQWVNLDRRGNWLDYRDYVDGISRRETRVANSVNEYTQIIPEAPDPEDEDPPQPAQVSPVHDKAGNLTFNPLARNVGNPCGTSVPTECNNSGQCDPTKPGCGLGREYEYDAENRLVLILRDTNDVPGRNALGMPELIKLMEFVYDALGRRVETIEYVNPATGELWDGQGSNPPPRRTRHVYFGLEVIQEYVCGGENVFCEAGPAMVREFLHGGRGDQVGASTGIARASSRGIPCSWTANSAA